MFYYFKYNHKPFIDDHFSHRKKMNLLFHKLNGLNLCIDLFYTHVICRQPRQSKLHRDNQLSVFFLWSVWCILWAPPFGGLFTSWNWNFLIYCFDSKLNKLFVYLLIIPIGTSNHTIRFSIFALISLARVKKASSTLMLALAEVSTNLMPYSTASFSPRSFVTLNSNL